MYHGTQYIDEVVAQRIANLGRVYVHQDANYNVTGTTDLTARQIERNYYSPYGQLEVAINSHPFDYDDDGDVDVYDYHIVKEGTCSGTATADCRRLDADADGDVDSADRTTIESYIATLTTDTKLTRIPAATESQRGNNFGHQGLVFDAELASYQNRARQRSPQLKRFVQNDSLRLIALGGAGYHDGMHLQQVARSNPAALLDPSGNGCCHNRTRQKQLTTPAQNY